MIPDRLVLQLCGVSQGHVDPCLRWGSVSHARMAALPVVEDLDVFEERGLRPRRVRNRVRCTSSVLRAPKKLSIGALSRQFPFLLIDALLPFASSNLR